MKTPLEILKSHWGYEQFRNPQESIINSVLEGNDTLALIPTGGGKSVCYQVPALYSGKLALVISPLIALMNDQVEQLKQRNINAIAVHSGLHPKEIDIALDNCIYGEVQFLYVSPERIQTELFAERLKKMDLSLIAIDEAHCVSQWGKDFRPSYLELIKLRDMISSSVPMIAVTASATPKVEQDILDLIGLESPKKFKESVNRNNLSLSIYHEENKRQRLIKALDNVSGSTIIYVKNRKSTKELCQFLKQSGYSSTYYHAGLDFETKRANQQNWQKGKQRIMVCTNAFGMGIDKPDVRLVIHMDPPQSLEAYYQEVGRGGRDGFLSFGLAMVSSKDILSLEESTDQKFADQGLISKFYSQISNRFKIAIGSGALHSYAIDIVEISKYLGITPQLLFKVFESLEKMGVLEYLGPQNWASSLNIIPNNHDLYKFQVERPEFDHLLKSILRIYGGGLFTQFLRVDEKRIADFALISSEEVFKKMEALNNLNILDYNPGKSGSRLYYPIGRVSEKFLTESYDKYIKTNKVAFKDRLDSALSFYKQKDKCRMMGLKEYFGEESGVECGLCDYCIEKKKGNQPNKIQKEILEYLKEQKAVFLDDYIKEKSKSEEERITQVVRVALDQNILFLDSEGKIRIKE